MEDARIEEPVYESERSSWRDRGPLWPFLPAALVLSLFLWLVPGSFVQMARIHQGQMDEIAQLPGYEPISTDVHWYPIEWGGTVVLAPLAGQDALDLKREMVGLGYSGSALGSRTVQTRPRADGYDAELVAVFADGGNLAVDVGVADTDIVVTWSFIAVIGACIVAVLAGTGAAVRHRIATRTRDRSVM